MARPDLHPSQGPASSYSSTSCKTSAADTIPRPYAAPADAHRPVTMTSPHYERPHTASDGVFYPIYPEFYYASGMDYSAAGAATGQPPPLGVSATNEVDVAWPPGWDCSMFDVQMPYPLFSPGTAKAEGDVPKPEAPWDYGAQAHPALIDTTIEDALAMANPMPQYVSVEQPAMAESMSHHVAAKESANGWYDSLGWPPPPPMGQLSPSPSQNSYHTSSPASGVGAQYSRHNSCSSQPAARVAALEQTRFDARFRPVPDQAVSPGEGRFVPGGLEKGADFSYALQTTGQWGNSRGPITKTTTTTTDHAAGTVSPAMTPSPRDADQAVSSHPATQSARSPPNPRDSKASKRKEKRPATVRQTTNNQKQAEAGVQSQGQQQQQYPEAGSQAKVQAEAQATQPAVRHRNRDAANKCRAKTKKAVSDLESTERAMSSEHRELSATARGLRDEVLMLKNELLAHGGCDDVLIQQYLTNQARRVGYGAAQAQGPQQREQQDRQSDHPHSHRHRHQGHSHK